MLRLLSIFAKKNIECGCQIPESNMGIDSGFVS